MKLKLLLEEKTIESIYHSGDEDFDALVKKDKEGEWIYAAGEDWKVFDYKKGLDALIKKDKEGEWIYHSGKHWKIFDYKKGLDTLIKIDKTGRLIYYAGKHWKKFDYEKGLEALKEIKDKEYYKFALEEWPQGIQVSQAKSKEIKNTAKKMKPSKKLRL